MTNVNNVSKFNYNLTTPVNAPTQREEQASQPEFLFDFALHESIGNMQVNMGEGGYFNGGKGYVMASPGYSFVQANLFLTPEQAQTKWKLTLSHLVTRPQYSQISITVNGAAIANYFLDSQTLKDDLFLIDLHEGHNSIKIKLLAEGYAIDYTLPVGFAPYAIRTISLDPIF